jgi:hypothetical protein
VTPLPKVLTYKSTEQCQASSELLTPPPPLHPTSVSSPRTKGGGWGVHTRQAMRGWWVNSSEDARHRVELLKYNPSTLHSQSRQSTRLFHQLSELGPPHPLAHRRVCPPPLVRGGGTHSLAEKGSQFGRGDRQCRMYFVTPLQWFLANIVGNYPNISHFIWHFPLECIVLVIFFAQNRVGLPSKYLTYPRCGAFS